jgi:hypothetical protein
MRTEFRPLATTGRYAALVGVVLFAAVPVYLYLEPHWRAHFARVAAALVLGMALLELRGLLAGRLARHGTSALDTARIAAVVEPGAPHRLRELSRSVRAGLRSRRHFEQVLWPRLTALTGRPLVPPPLLAGLRDLIARIEGER